MAAMQVDEIVARLAQRDPLPPLNPHPQQPFDQALSQIILRAGFAPTMTCGLLIWNDDFNTAHPIAQGIDTPDGSYWHAIIHRQEADYSNARYWFRRVGNHPVLRALAAVPEAKPFVKNGAVDAAAVVDACERAPDGEEEAALRRLQVTEFNLLLQRG
jgi:hypothetical protein